MPYKRLSRDNIALFSIIILALILRVIYLGSKSLWLDEATNILMAEKSISTWTFGEPPLYYIVLHFTLAVGKSEIVVRFPSVVFGVLSVFIIYKIGIILYGEKEALVGAFLLSISQTAIQFSQDTKYYSLFIFLSLASVYFFLRMEEKPTNSNKVLFLVFLTLAFYAHYFTVLLLFALIIFKIWKYKNEKRNMKEIKSFFLLIGIFLLLIIPILSHFISQTMSRTGASNINFVYQTHLSINFMKEIFTYLLVNEFYGTESIHPYIILGLFLYGVYSSLEYHEKSIIFLTMWLFIPIALAAILTNIVSNLYIRYIAFVLPALLLISSRGIVAIPDRVNHLVRKAGFRSIKFNSFMIILILIIVVLSSYPILNSYYKSQNYDWRGTAEFIEKNAENGSNIVLVPGYNSNPFNYYYKSKNKTNVIEYSTFDEFVKLSNQNNTYLVKTGDIYGLKPDELNQLISWYKNNMKIAAQLSSITILKNVTTNDSSYKPHIAFQ